jgi:hypothetical protein
VQQRGSFFLPFFLGRRCPKSIFGLVVRSLHQFLRILGCPFRVWQGSLAPVLFLPGKKFQPSGIISQSRSQDLLTIKGCALLGKGGFIIFGDSSGHSACGTSI